MVQDYQNLGTKKIEDKENTYKAIVKNVKLINKIEKDLYGEIITTFPAGHFILLV